MNAQVVTIEEFWNRNCESEKGFFNNNTSKYCIPKYQREYKWEGKNINELVTNILSRSKFLGIITLDEKTCVNDAWYEVVDGQQRLTTIYLLLVQLYNILENVNIEHNYDQEEILSHIFCNNFFLKNDSLDEYLKFNEQKSQIELLINTEKDIYKQKKRFESAFNSLEEFVRSTFIKNEAVQNYEVIEYLNKILKCEVLVLINNSMNDSESTEGIYVDINQKAQTLDVEDIFKGNCFLRVHKSNQELLKEKWISVKRNGFVFRDEFRFKDFDNFLYIYFLIDLSNPGLTENLELNNKHILDKKVSNDIMTIIDGIQKFSDNVILYYESMKNNEYNFSDICTNSINAAGELTFSVIKYYSKWILNHRLRYLKLPFFVFVNFVMINGNRFDYNEFKRLMSHYYIYSIIFTSILSTKSKDLIFFDHIKFVKEYVFDDTATPLLDIKRNLKEEYRKLLKNESCISLNKKFDKEATIGLYSIIDNYSGDKEEISMLYLYENKYTDEHFIINEKNKIVWKNNQFEFKFKIENLNSYKGLLVNRIILYKTLNEDVKSYDIVTKIEMIKEYYPEDGVPRHINIFISHIEAMKEYQILVKLKSAFCTSESEIKEKYIAFIDKYFNEEYENSSILIKQIFNSFINAQANN